MSKIKTSYALSETLHKELDDTAQFLGVSRSDLLSLGLARFLVQMVPLRKHPLKRRVIFRRLSEEFQTMCDALNDSL